LPISSSRLRDQRSQGIGRPRLDRRGWLADLGVAIERAQVPSGGRRWEQGRTGWHEAIGSATLRQHWPQLPCGERVLVPLCGKTKDLIWLEARGLSVIGIELSRIAVEAIFAENRLSYSVIPDGA
jgi:hypothetical protein